MEQKILKRGEQEILNECESFRNRLYELYPGDSFSTEFGETISEFINKVTINSLKAREKSLFSLDNKSHIWIGINPPPGSISLKLLFDQTVKACSKFKMLENHAYTIEANTDGGYRPHVHMMCPAGTRPSRVVQLLSKHFKVNPQSIECKAYYSGLLYDEHLRYIKGEKKNEKISNVEKDIVERNEEEIPHFILSPMYISNGPSEIGSSSSLAEVSFPDTSPTNEEALCSESFDSSHQECDVESM